MRTGGGKPDGLFFKADGKLVGIAELKWNSMRDAEGELHAYAKTALERTPDETKRLVGAAGVGSDSLEIKWFLYDLDVSDGEPQPLVIELPRGQALTPQAVYKLYEVRSQTAPWVSLR